MSDIHDENKLRKHIANQINKRVQDIDLDTSPYSLRLKLAENEFELFDFDDELVEITFNANYYKLLENLINKYKNDLIKLANLYQEKNRDFSTFLYDLIVLVYFVNELPDEFQRLLEKDELQSEGDLMHNRVLSQTAFNLNKNYNVKLNRKSKKNPSPDLTVDEILVDIKTIVGRYNWIKEDVSKLIRTVDEKYSKAMKQTANGVVFISFWSKNMNNLFRDYFYGQHKTTMYQLENNSCYFVMDGIEVLQDFYTSKHVYDLRNNLPDCNLICNYTPMNSPSPYGMFQIGRKGFPIAKMGSPNDFGISFSMG